MQAIVTKYLGPTNYSGSRVKASCDAGSVTVSYAHEYSLSDNHDRAASVLAQKLGWFGVYASGSLPDGRYAHVSAPEADLVCNNCWRDGEMIYSASRNLTTFEVLKP